LHTSSEAQLSVKENPSPIKTPAAGFSAVPLPMRMPRTDTGIIERSWACVSGILLRCRWSVSKPRSHRLTDTRNSLPSSGSSAHVEMMLSSRRTRACHWGSDDAVGPSARRPTGAACMMTAASAGPRDAAAGEAGLVARNDATNPTAAPAAHLDRRLLFRSDMCGEFPERMAIPSLIGDEIDPQPTTESSGDPTCCRRRADHREQIQICVGAATPAGRTRLERLLADGRRTLIGHVATVISARRVLASVVVILSVVGVVGASAPSPAEADRVGPQREVANRQAISPVAATDAHGNTTALWLEQDRVDDTGLPDQTKWRARTGTLAYGSSKWTLGSLLSTTGAVYTHPQDGQGMSPRHAIATSPSGTTVIAWVQTIAGEKQIQMAYSPGFAQPFRPPTTIPAETACATLSDIRRLTISIDDAGGALTYVDACLSGALYRRAVHIDRGGAFGVSRLVAQTSPQATVLRTSSTTSTIVTYESFFTGLLTAYTLGANGVTGSRVIVKETTAGTNGIDVALNWRGEIVSAINLQVGDSKKIVVDVNNGNSPDTPVDRTMFDPVTDTTPFSPAVAAGADGTVAVAWIEGPSVWVATRYRADPWSTPVVISDPADGGMVQDSVKVGVSPGGITHVAWTTQVNNGGVVAYGSRGAVRGARTAIVPAPQWSAPYLVLNGSIFPDMTVLEDGWATWTSTIHYQNRPYVWSARVEAPEDDVKPIVSGAVLSRTRLSPGTRLDRVAVKKGRTSVSGRTYSSDLKVGVTLRFMQSEWGKALFEVKHVGCASTKLIGKPKEKLVRCDPRRLSGVVYSATFDARAGVRGENRMSWTGQTTRGKTLAAGGKYVISLTAIDATGNRSRTATFKVEIDGASRR
jgi:hypothetical protein